MLAPQLATWPSGLGKGLQSPVPGFDSLRRLYFGVLLVLFSPYFIRILYQCACLVHPDCGVPFQFRVHFVSIFDHCSGLRVCPSCDQQLNRQRVGRLFCGGADMCKQ